MQCYLLADILKKSQHSEEKMEQGTDAAMAYSYEYLDASLVPLPIYAPQQAPYSADDADTTFEEWPVTNPPTADCNMGNEPYHHRYTSDEAYLNASSHPHWHTDPPLTLSALVPQFPIPPLDQWQGSTSSTILHMTPEMEHCNLYRLSTPEPSSASSSLPIRGRARAPIVYEEYEVPQDSLPQRFVRRRKNGVVLSSRARADHQRSSRPKTPRTMPSTSKRTGAASPTLSAVSHPSAHQSNSLSQLDYPQPSEERHFACEKGCPARFARKRDRDRHERSVHTGQTPYRCNGCQAGFVRSDARGRHWKIEPECHKKHLLVELLEEPSPGPE